MIVFALDSNIISYLLKRDKEVSKKFRQETLSDNEFIIRQ